ncbi:uncharacterized protein LOC134251199, partial [Saccostrea cucullata]|uniref:uncharacterized protein LOC134251199 n=1 Tax=Saccostrea cuccullata TaxID=36930 RepID=UPI002ED1A5D8
MPRKAKKSAERKASEQRLRMQQRRNQATGQSVISLNCPEESVTSIKCPKESVTSIKCPEESVTSIKCPEESVTSIKCPEESNTSLNCPEESNISIKCPESVTSIKCPNQIENKTNRNETNMLKRNKQEIENKNKTARSPPSKMRKVDRKESQFNSGKEIKLAVVQGTFHQGDSRFGRNSGKQCVANSLSAIAHSKLKDVDKWDQAYLDNVLIEGNEIYTWIHGTNDLLLMSDLPEMIEISGKMMQIRKKDSISATIDSNGTIDFSAFGNCLPLDLAIQESLMNSDGCFICAINQTFMVIKYKHDLYLFDSHSRNSFGLVDGNGKSLLMQLENLDHLYDYCCNLVHGVDQTNQWFEVTGIRITTEEILSTENVLHSFNAMEDGLMQNNVNYPSGQESENAPMPGRESNLPRSDSNFSKHESLPTEDVSESEDMIHNHLSIPECELKIQDDTSSSLLQCSSDIEIVSENEDRTSYNFIPLTIATKRELCNVLHISSKQVCKKQSDVVYNMGPPKETKSIEEDGNCLFRAISYAVSNRQQYYHKVRGAVVNHIKKTDALKSFLRPEFQSVEQYIQMSKMENDKTWGTELEILAAADLLKTDIFTFLNGSWIKYSSSQICSNNKVKGESIYLKHTGNSNHYECVTFVNDKDLSQATRNMQTKNSKIGGRKRNAKRVKQMNAPVTKVLKTDSMDCNQETFRDSSKAVKEKEKYKTSKEFREKKKNTSKQKYETDPKHRATIIKRMKNHYKNDDEYRETIKNANKIKYETNYEFREKVKAASKEKYETDDDFREKKKNASKEKFETDADFREKMNNACKEKYEKDDDFREKKKNASKEKYEKDDDFREKKKNASKEKYEKDDDFREYVKNFSMNKYEKDINFRNTVKETSKRKYDQIEAHREKIKCQVKFRRDVLKKECENIENVIEKFKADVKSGPEYVCSCCFRLLFENQVLFCNKEKYNSMLLETCISEKYLHKCDTDCASGCSFAGTSRTNLWICYTCHRKLLKGDVPCMSFANNTELEKVPEVLECLNSLEQHLISLNIPFMKILGLPKGGQKGVHGPVVCVPSDLRKVTSILPRSEDENLLLKVKLKRKLKYKGYEEYQFVNSKHLEEALLFLKENNFWYSDVKVNENWLNPIPEEKELDDIVDCDDETANAEITSSRCDNASENSEDITVKCTENEAESFLDENLRGIQLDTCLQPADIGQEVLDLCFDKVFEISPAEGNNPVSVLKEEGIEAKTFPVHFPSGKNTYSEERNEKLTLGRYFNLRLMSVENRFARDTSYLFFSQYLSELERVISNVQISLRKESAFSADGSKITGEMLCDKNVLKNLFKKDEAIKFLKPVRGTPPYWQAAQKDIFAMIRQLGIPQFFCSFSSADFRWTEIVETILKQQGDTRKLENLTWNDKCKILRSNPVTAARMFDHRFHTFLNNVIMSDAEPIGKVIDYFYRIEFQQRGSPHTHCLFWIEGAPKFGENSDSEVVEFIDRYVTCEVPDEQEDQELHDIVMSVQQHSKNHSKSCKKKGTVCRFNFPRPPSQRTFISKPHETSSTDRNEDQLAKERLSFMWDTLKSNENVTTSNLLQKSGLTQEEFELCFSFITKRNTIVLKREPIEVYTNQYNKHLLRAWNANMDIQYILDAFSCVVYIISYISKAERELGLLLQHTKNEAIEGNLHAQEAMKKVGTAYMHHREISAQEAVYRVTGLRLRECSRKVEFVPVGENPCRMSIPLKDVRRKTDSKIKKPKDSNEKPDDAKDESDIWLTNIVDRYEGRPNIDMFQKMCLASFCSEFAVLAESQLPKKINEETTFKLSNKLGYIRKRTKTKPAVIRFPRFSVEAASEKYYQSILQLFLPYRDKCQLKPAKFETYETFYETGYVKYSGEKTLLSVKHIVDCNMSEFVKDGENLEEAERILDAQGPQEDAWCELCPETEKIRLECMEDRQTVNVEDEDISEKSVPDLSTDNREGTGTNLLCLSLPEKNEVTPLLQSLNSKQQEVFYKVRDWCLKKKNGQNPDPFHLF